MHAHSVSLITQYIYVNKGNQHFINLPESCLRDYFNRCKPGVWEERLIGQGEEYCVTNNWYAKNYWFVLINHSLLRNIGQTAA